MTHSYQQAAALRKCKAPYGEGVCKITAAGRQCKTARCTTSKRSWRAAASHRKRAWRPKGCSASSDVSYAGALGVAGLRAAWQRAAVC